MGGKGPEILKYLIYKVLSEYLGKDNTLAALSRPPDRRATSISDCIGRIQAIQEKSVFFKDLPA